MYYMATLMNQIGFDKRTSVFMSLVGGGSLLLGTIPAIFYMEKFGRRFWACAMLPGFFIGLLIIGCGYLAPISNFPAAAGTYITGLIIYEGFFGSYACLTWVLPAEVYPTYLRSYGMETSYVLSLPIPTIYNSFYPLLTLNQGRYTILLLLACDLLF
jgi:hypothetical protein